MQTDYVQRFIFEELDIRGRLVCLTGAWRQMLDGRAYPGGIVSLLGHTTALNVLLGANQKGSGRITTQVQGSGPVRLLVADCTAELKIRGMAQYDGVFSEEKTERTLLGDGRLSVTLEDQSTGRLYQSLVPLEGESLQDIFEHYLSQSEQLSSWLRLYADGDAVAGLLLEKLPGADQKDPDGWDRVRHLAGTLQLDETRDAQPYDLLTRLFPEELMRVFRLYAVEYHCPYDVEKVKDMLRGLGREEVESILAEKGEVVIRNEMCNHEYRFDARGVAAIFAS
ncbi:MAG: Hsp33 family molecular chaperone HslO [Clostridia bacterium]